jgi:hypothetical protein
MDEEVAPNGNSLVVFPSIQARFITMVNAEGKQVGPAIFTHNPDLDPDGHNGVAVQAKCKILDLDVDNIYFVKSNKHYHKEDTNCYYSFLSEYGTWEGHRVISNQGMSFKVDSEDLFLSLGFDCHETFTPSTHGPLSINDGHLHSVAKAAWHQQQDDNDPEWVHTLLLAHEYFMCLLPKQLQNGSNTCCTSGDPQQREWRNCSLKVRSRKMLLQNYGNSALCTIMNLHMKMN